MIAGDELQDTMEGLDEADLSWTMDMFDDISTNQLSHDDLLTDVVSEFMKYKTDLPDLDLLRENVNIDDLLADGMDLGTVEAPEVILEGAHSVGESGHSSGYTSAGSSSGLPSPNSSPSKADSSEILPSSLRSSDVLDDSQALKKIKVGGGAGISTLPASVRSGLDIRTHIPLKSTISTVSAPGNNRVRFIVRPNRIINIQSKNKSSSDTPIYGNISRIQTFPKSRLQAVPMESKGSPDGRSLSCGTKNPGIVHFVKATDGSFKQSSSPPNLTSLSSSDSDMRDSVDEDGISVISDYPPSHFNTYELSGIPTASRLRTESGKGYNIVYSGNPTSRVSGLSCLSFDDSADGQFLQSSRLSSHTGVLRGQLPSKGRSPTRIDRSDVSQTGILVLTDEEKRTLLAEGYSIPTRLPLSKQEERNLKRVRRKIKNKISAQESRRKKKEYVEALERKLNACVQENMDLKRRNDGLESTNRSLLGQLRLMQQLLNKPKATSGAGSSTNAHSTSTDSLKSGSRHTSGGGVGSASTCLMVFALCFAALLVGQPPDLNSHTSVGLTFGPHPHSLLNDLISNGPGSLSKIGYTWASHRDYDASYNPKHVNWYSGSNCSNLPLLDTRSRHVDRVRRVKWRDELMSHLNKRRPWSPESASRAPASRSRLLGAPNELDECVATPRSFWSYLFGLSSQPAAICTHGDRPSRAVDSELVLEFDDSDTPQFEDLTSVAPNGSNQHVWSRTSVPLVALHPPSNISRLDVVITSA